MLFFSETERQEAFALEEELVFFEELEELTELTDAAAAESEAEK